MKLPPQPRPYQFDLMHRASEALEEVRAAVLVLPTGGGKTVCIGMSVFDIVQQGGSAWVVAHREELVDQISATFHDFGIDHGLVKSGLPLIQHPIQVGMIQTLRNKLQRMVPPDFVYIDECHHTPASQYDYVIQSMPEATRIVGVTATPCRLDGKGLDKYYQRLILGPSISDLIGMGYLVPPIVYAPQLIDATVLGTKFGDYTGIDVLFDDPKIIGNCVEHYKKLAPGKSAVAFCSSVAKAEETAKRFTENGIPAGFIHGDMDKRQRKQILDDFRARRILVLCNKDLISEGFDCPGIEAIIMLRPTKSLSLYLQMIGRALRLLDGKENAIIIDHVGNTIYHFPETGDPTQEVGWDLEGAKKRPKGEEFLVEQCSVCYRIFRGEMCPYCKVRVLGGGMPREPIAEVAGQLVQLRPPRSWLTKEEIAHIWTLATNLDLVAYCTEINIGLDVIKRVLTKSAKSYEQLLHVGKLLGYSQGWAKHKAEGRHYGEPENQLRLEV